MAQPKMVTVKSLADEWKISPAAARRYLMIRGVPMEKRRDESRRNQKVLCLTEEEAKKIRKLRDQEGLQ